MNAPNDFFEFVQDQLSPWSEVPSYYELPVDVLENAEAFIEWAQESYAIQVNKHT